MANEQWKNDASYAMTLFKLLTWPIGVWPLQVYNIYSLIRCILATCCMCLMVILPSIEIYMGCTDAEQNVDSLMLICCGILGILKTIWFRIYAKNLSNNYNSALTDYLMVENQKQRAVMRKHASIGRILCCSMLGFSYFSCIIYALIPFFGDNKNKYTNETNENVLEYTMPSRCALEFFNTPASMYRFLCFIETISFFVTSTSNHGNDSMFLNITLHICGQVEILKTKFINFDITRPKVYERFITLIKRHSYLIKMTRQLIDTVSFILLIQLFIISIQLCITGFQFILALKVNDAVMAGKSMMVQGTFLLQLSLYSFIGDYLTCQMEEIGLSIYQIAWYNLPVEVTRKLVFIIMRTETPVILQAGHFFVINVSTYMSILKTSISYLSVLRVMVET